MTRYEAARAPAATATMPVADSDVEHTGHSRLVPSGGLSARATTDSGDRETRERELDVVIERLRGEFAGQLDQAAVVEAVRTSRDALAGAPIGALPELIERLARQDLLDRTDGAGGAGAAGSVEQLRGGRR